SPMKSLPGAVVLLLLAAQSFAQAKPTPPKYPGLPSETPATLVPSTTGFDYERRDVMIAMRDGVRLHTVILVPKGAKGAPMLLTRTPYSANALTTHRPSSHLASALNGYDSSAHTIVG